MPDIPKHVVRSRSLAAAEGRRIRHPLNPNSEILIHPLSERVGLQRAVLSLARVPPGKESFILHAHERDEECVYILEGQGTAQIGDQRIAVGPGDFMGFPIDGTPHHLVNTGTTDLVYLMGGERSTLDVGRFPSVGKSIVFRLDQRGARVELFDDAAAQPLAMEDFLIDDDKG